MALSEITFAESGGGLNGPLGWLYEQDARTRTLLTGQIPAQLTVAAPTSNFAAVSTTTNAGNLKGFIAAQPAGTTYWFTPGQTFRLSTLGFPLGDPGIIAKDNDRFLTDPANPAVLLGSVDVSTGWSLVGGVWRRIYTSAQVTPNDAGSSTICALGTVCTSPDDLYVNGVQQLRASTATVAAGEYFIDYAADFMYLGSDPTGKTVEVASVRYGIVGGTSVTGSGQAKNVIVDGFEMRHFANRSQYGAVASGDGGSGWQVRNCYLHQNHAAGVSVVDGGIVEWCRIEENGQLGIKAFETNFGAIPNPSGVTFRYNRLVGNKLHGLNAGYNNGWEGGGSKFGRVAHNIVEFNYCSGNLGGVLWSDESNYDTAYRYNVLEGNLYGGDLFQEGSYDAEIHHNLILRGGVLDTRGDANGWWGAGITVSTSNRTNVHHNVVVKCKQAIMFVQQDRSNLATGRNEVTHALTTNVAADREFHQIEGSFCDDNLCVMEDTDYGALRGGASLVIGQKFGAVANFVPPNDSIFTGGVLFRRNTFYVALAASRFKFAGTDKAGSAWQSTYSTVVSGSTFIDIAAWRDSWLPVGLQS